MTEEELNALIKRDPIAGLCWLLRECGATMTLYGKPVSEEELRSHALNSAMDRIANAIKGTE